MPLGNVNSPRRANWSGQLKFFSFLHFNNISTTKCIKGLEIYHPKNTKINLALVRSKQKPREQTKMKKEGKSGKKP